MIDVNPHALCLALTRWPAGRSPLLTLSVTCVLAVAMSAVGVVRRAVSAAHGVAANLVHRTRHRSGVRVAGRGDRRRAGRPYRPLCGPLAGFQPLSVSVAGSNRLRAPRNVSGAALTRGVSWPRPAWSAVVRQGCAQRRCAATVPADLWVWSGAESAGCGPLRAVAAVSNPLFRALLGTPRGYGLCLAVRGGSTRRAAV